MPESEPKPRANRGLWRDADFVRLFAAATVSNFGSMITTLALPLLAIRTLAASPAEALGFSLLVAQQLADGGEVVFDVHQTSVRQAAVPAELRGRVAGSIAFLGQAAMLAGSVLGGLLGSTVGPRATLVVGALGVLLAAPVVAVGPGLRRARER